MRSEKKAEASVGEQHAASSGSLATYKPENDMSQGMQFLARLLMNVGAGMNTGSFNPGKGAGMGSQPQAKTLALQDAPPLPVDDAKREQCTGPVHAPAARQKKEADNDMGLEACEKEAFEKLKNRNVMKRPAAQQKPEAKTMPVKKQKVKPASNLKLGCRKCRGCVNGCTQCRSASYTGLRMNRAEWVAFAQKNGLK